ncbi:hypothetical protein [Aliihoeflea sp. 40Bstr573]|uniref:hypothetical protein n=1 Tax=Aliihoeflea sp. 40Bstr573 TaxID=2696467 RepID=UPI002095D91A|nr:hypothetical protein [Aliihoeflea sp. 40Bstr573]MCO6386251.1 hypothetical protein [Aliihoeflea sp. 40Bstr573]
MGKTYCRIEDGVVADVALFDGNMPRNWPDYHQWKLGHGVQIGWTYDGSKFHPPEAPEPAPATEDDYRRAIQRHVDATAQSRSYDNGNSLASYKDSTIAQWSDEAVAFIAWRDQVWLYAYAELDKVMAGEREQPSVEDFVRELPAIGWPASTA